MWAYLSDTKIELVINLWVRSCAVTELTHHYHQTLMTTPGEHENNAWWTKDRFNGFVPGIALYRYEGSSIRSNIGICEFFIFTSMGPFSDAPVNELSAYASTTSIPIATSLYSTGDDRVYRQKIPSTLIALRLRFLSFLILRVIDIAKCTATLRCASTMVTGNF